MPPVSGCPADLSGSAWVWAEGADGAATDVPATTNTAVAVDADGCCRGVARGVATCANSSAPAARPSRWCTTRARSKTNGALLGLTGIAPRSQSIPAGAAVQLDARSVAPADPDVRHPVVEAALRDTLVHRAEGTALDRLGRLFGLPRPSVILESSWRLALKAAAYGPRHTPGCIRDFLRGALTQWDTVVSVRQSAAAPQRITALSGTPFTQEHVGRDVVIDGVTYRVIGPATVGGTYLELAPMTTFEFARADWSAFPAIATTTATILPFRLEEPSPNPGGPGKSCLARVRLWLSLAAVPPTYLIDYSLPVGDPPPGPEPGWM